MPTEMHHISGTFSCIHLMTYLLAKQLEIQAASQGCDNTDVCASPTYVLLFAFAFRRAGKVFKHKLFLDIQVSEHPTPMVSYRPHPTGAASFEFADQLKSMSAKLPVILLNTETHSLSRIS